MNINYFGVSEFLHFHQRKVPFRRTHTYEYLQTLVNEVNVFKPSLLVVKWTCRLEKSDEQVPVLCLHVTFSSLASPLEPHPEITWSGLEAETRAACTPERHPGSLFCLVSSLRK
jgi:hypothetical protein